MGLRQRTIRGVAAIAMIGGLIGSGAAVVLGTSVPEAGAVPTTSPCPAPVISNGTAKVTCSYNGTNGNDGSAQSWTVPAGVTQATFDVYGAEGGGSLNGESSGGAGGETMGTFNVTPGSTFQINVGGQPSGAAAGHNGGGSAGILGTADGGGGGASDVRTGATVVPFVVAGGGGGGGYVTSPEPVMILGGSGGGGNGGVGTPGNCVIPGSSSVYCGGGGTNTTGGAAGTTMACSGFPLTGTPTVTAPNSGGSGTGGDGGSLACPFEGLQPTSDGGGGGGGGYYGGGGGAAAVGIVEVNGSQVDVEVGGSGGGGSGYIDTSLLAQNTSPTYNNGVQLGNGKVVITYTATTPPTTRVLVPSSGATLSGTTATLDASATNATSVEFLLFGGSYGYSAHVACTATLTYYGWLCSWNTATVPNGTYALLSEASGTGGNAFSSHIGITVTNTPPTATIVYTGVIPGEAGLNLYVWDATASPGVTSVRYDFYESGACGVGTEVYTNTDPAAESATPTLYGWVSEDLLIENYNANGVQISGTLCATATYPNGVSGTSAGLPYTLNLGYGNIVP